MRTYFVILVVLLHLCLIYGKGNDGEDGSVGNEGNEGKDGGIKLRVKSESDSRTKGSVPLDGKGNDGKDGSDGNKGNEGNDGNKDGKGNDGKDGKDGKKECDGKKGKDGEDCKTIELKTSTHLPGIKNEEWNIKHPNMPLMPIGWKERFKKPYHSAWMDYCDPGHCNDYHKVACGLNRKTMRFKWFQSACHIKLNNKCSTYRGSLKYDWIDTKFCHIYVMYLRQGCTGACVADGPPVCAVSLLDNHVTLFEDQCALEAANCKSETFHEYEPVDPKLCSYYLENDEKVKK